MTTRLVRTLRNTLAVVCMLFAMHGYGQSIQPDSASTLEKLAKILSKFELKGYGVVNYYAYDWDTWEDKRNALDPERLNLYLYYNFTDNIQFKSEIEFEHGGTGSTMSFDPLEEFGEFEDEIEFGGSVVLEQINLYFKVKKYFNVRVGKMRLYLGNASKQDEPTEYFTAYRSEVENTILPLGWYETGLELSGDITLKKNSKYPQLAYKVYVVSGLDNTGFSSFNWVRPGYQTRFETINANAFAYAFRLDFQFAKDSEIGFNYYACNATPNRPKDDFTADSWVTYSDVHFTWEGYPWRARAYGMLGNVQNSEALSAANRNLSNNLGVKRTPVAKAAGGAYAELAFDVLSFFELKKDHKFYLFGRAEWYDSMLETAGTITDNPRYERQVWTAGVNYFPISKVVLKAHFASRKLGTGELENTTAIGLGFKF